MTTYLLIYKFGQAEMAQAFESSEDAIKCVNRALKDCNSIVDKLVDHENGSWDIKLLGCNTNIELRIEPVRSDELKFYLDKYENKKFIETRSFSKREYALKFTRKTLKEKYHHRSRYHEDFCGRWKARARKDSPAVDFLLFTTIVKQSQQKIDETNDYKTLGISESASEGEAKKAYHKLSKIYHPDMPTGNKEKFQEIEEAYRRIKDKRGKKGAKKERSKVLASYRSYDFYYFCSELCNSANNAIMRHEMQDALKGLILTVIALVVLAIFLVLYKN